MKWNNICTCDVHYISRFLSQKRTKKKTGAACMDHNMRCLQFITAQLGSSGTRVQRANTWLSDPGVSNPSWNYHFTDITVFSHRLRWWVASPCDRYACRHLCGLGGRVCCATQVIFCSDNFQMSHKRLTRRPSADAVIYLCSLNALHVEAGWSVTDEPLVPTE